MDGVMNAVREDVLNSALKSVRDGILSERSAAKVYDVSRRTLHRRLIGIRPQKKGEWLRKFTDAEEDFIAEVMIKCQRLGAPWNKQFLRRIIPRLLQAKGMNVKRLPFTDEWHKGFLKRHPRVSQRITHSVNRKKHREWTAENRKGWIDKLSELHVAGFLDDPCGIWNLDESAFKVAERVSVVYAERGTKEVLSYYDGTDCELVTVLAGGNAAGETLRPLILYDGKVLMASRLDGTDDRCYAGVNSSGIMDRATFANYVRREVIPAMTAEKNVIFLDGHDSHMLDDDFIEECLMSEKDITVVIFPAGQTDKLQPMDVKVSGPVKKYWRDFLRLLPLLLREAVSKQNFAQHLMEKWDDFNMAKNLQSGFGAAGIYPFNPENVSQRVLEMKKKPEEPEAAIPDSTQLQASEVFAKEFENMKAVLRKTFPVSNASVEKAMKIIAADLDGDFKPSIESQDLALVFRDGLMKAHPKKKRVAKDTRLQMDKGMFLMSSEVREARRKLDEKRAQKKASYKPKKQPLKNVTNTPEKQKQPRKKAAKRK